MCRIGKIRSTWEEALLSKTRSGLSGRLIEVKINRLTFADATIGDYILFSGTSAEVSNSYGIGDERISYDRIGNILSLERRVKGTVNYSDIEHFNYAYTSGTNRLAAANGLTGTVTRQYTYDANGNVLTDDYRNIDTTLYGRAAYAYQLNKGSDTIEYLYSTDDQRIFKRITAPSETTVDYYLTDAMGRTIALLHNTDTTSNWEYYISGAEREARIPAGDTTSRILNKEASFYLYDHLGNTRVVYMPDAYMSSGGSYTYTVHTIQFAGDYFPYGKTLRKYVSGDEERFQTTQHERDEETGLDYRGARYYDADIARFLSLDPLARDYPSMSDYCYVGNMPTMAIDPNGKDIIFTVSVNDDGQTVINMTVNAKLVNDSKQSYSYEQMDCYAERISNAITQAFSKSGYSDLKDDNGESGNGKYVVNVNVNISIADEENPVNANDHVYRIVEPKDIPASGNNIAAWGYSDEGMNFVYLNSSILENIPAVEGIYAGTGKTSTGGPTLERTSAHETGHSAGLVYGIYGHGNIWPGNLMTSTSQPDAGMNLSTVQILRLINAFRNGETNNGIQEYEGN